MTPIAHGPSTPNQGARKLSVVVPVSERPSPLDRIYREFSGPLREAGFDAEFIFVTTPGNASLLGALDELMGQGEPIETGIANASVGETGLLSAGVAMAAHNLLLTLPAYPRIEADELPRVILPVVEGAPMCVARRWPRKDSWLNRIQNRVFHAMVRSMGGRRVRDVACGVRAMRRDVFEALPLYGDFHRFLPLVAMRDGYRVEEVDTAQHPEDRQPRIYSPGVYLRRILDVLGLFFLIRFTEKPLRFFGLVGAGATFAGGLIMLSLLIDRIQGQAIADRPLLLLGALFVVLGVQSIALGLIGEIIVHVNAPRQKGYRLLGSAELAELREWKETEGTDPEAPASPRATDPERSGSEGSPHPLTAPGSRR